MDRDTGDRQARLQDQSSLTVNVTIHRYHQLEEVNLIAVGGWSSSHSGPMVRVVTGLSIEMTRSRGHLLAF